MPADCPCYKCTTPVYEYGASGRPYVWNNLHARLVPCPDCGRPRSEYRDHGTWGEYECWWCTMRAAGPNDGPTSETQL